jgi:hypothetical protein
METALFPGEPLLHYGAANHQRGWETVGGRLFLTDRRLVFESHALNVQTGVTEIPLRDVADVRTCWTKFLNVLPVFPNSIAVETREGAVATFVVFGRGQWVAAIRQAIGGPPTRGPSEAQRSLALGDAWHDTF